MESLRNDCETIELNTRRIEVEGRLRADGLYVVSAHLVDRCKAPYRNGFVEEIPAGQPLHEMVASMLISADLELHDIEVESRAHPYPGMCDSVCNNYKCLIGSNLGKGWKEAIRTSLGPASRCSHLNELLGVAATPAIQMILLHKARKDQAFDPVLGLLDTCHALASDGPVARAARSNGSDQSPLL